MVLTHILTLSDASGQAGLSYPLSMSVAPGQGYLVVASAQQGALLVFDSLGGFDRQVGRVGRGPGEYLSVLDLQVGGGDTVHVWDPGNARMTTLAPDFSLVRSLSLPIMGGQAHAFPDGTVALMRPIGSPGRDRIVLFDPSASPIGSFMQEQSTSADQVHVARRRMGVSANGEIVAVAHSAQYRVELWTSSGTHLFDVVRTPDWFLRAPQGDGRSGLEPQLALVAFDGNDTIWTVSWVPEDLEEDDDGRSDRRPPGEQDHTWDSVVEAISLEDRCLLGTLRVDPRLIVLMPNGQAASYREDDDGLPYVEVWQLHLTPRN